MRRRLAGGMLLLALFLAACGARTSASVSTGGGFTSQELRAAAAYSTAHRGDALIVWQDGHILLEDYENGYSASDAHMLYSGTKSFWGPLVAAAVDDGLLTWDEPVANTITEWRADPRKARITIRQLISLTSGIDAGQVGSPPAYTRAIAAPALHDPGTTFQYGPNPYQVLGALLQRKLASRHQTVYSYLQSRILAPIGVHVASWTMQPNGDLNMPQGAVLTAQDWLTYGIFLLGAGRWQGKQIVSQTQFDQCLHGTDANPGYGETFWLNSPVSTALTGQGADDDNPFIRNAQIQGDQMAIAFQAPRDLFMAAGAFDQRLYIVPSRHLIIVRFGRASLSWKDYQLLDTLFA